MEFPLYDIFVNDYNDTYKDLDEKYDRDKGLYNIDYQGFEDKSSENKKFYDITPTMSSETLNNVFGKKSVNSLNNREIKIFEKWFQRFFDFRWKTQQDTWIISDGLRKLEDNHIEFSCIVPFLYCEDLLHFKDKLITFESDLMPWKYPISSSPYRFHTSLEEQKELSENWYNYLKNML